VSRIKEQIAECEGFKMNAPENQTQAPLLSPAKTIADLEASLQEEARFRAKIAALFEIERELAHAESLDALCRLAVELGRSRLGFDRLSLWVFADPFGTMRGTYGTDEYGATRDERSARMEGTKRAFVEHFNQGRLPFKLFSNSPLRNDQCEIIAYGDVAVAALWDGEEIIGHLNADNLFSQVPLSERTQELLILFASVIGHNYTHKQSEERRRAAANQFRLLSETVPVGIFNLDAEGQFLYVNPQWSEITGRTPESLRNTHWLEGIHPDDQSLLLNLRRTHRKRGMFRSEFRYVRPTGEIRWVSGYARALTDAHGKFTGYVGIIEDLTDHKFAQEQMLHLQKMESIGRLAGGVAHDFNNLIAAILGFTDLASEALTMTEAQGYLGSIHMACDKAAALTSQLLAFARKQPIAPKFFNLNTLILDTDKILRRLIGANIELITIPCNDLGLILADPTQIQQILVNLVVNARDAIGATGGRILVETDNVMFTPEDTERHISVAPTMYVMLAVTDTGKGMTAEQLSHIFEPFYTTKEEGRGTGLGLATCHSIVQQSGGHIWVYSEPENGSVFKVYFPLAEGTETEEAVQIPTAKLNAGTETILMAEDNPMLREFISRMLRDNGYRVLEATSGEEAIQIAQKTPDTIHLLLTDIVMPQKNGKEAAEAIQAKRPAIKLIFMSGYTDNVAIIRNDLTPTAPFLQKPFTARDLLVAIRQVLDQDETG